MEGVFVVSFQNKFGIINMQTDILQFCNVISRSEKQQNVKLPGKYLEF